MSKTKLFLALVLVLTCVLAFSTSFANYAGPQKPRLEATVTYVNYEDETDTLEVTVSGDGFEWLNDDVCYDVLEVPATSAGDGGEYYPSAVAVTLLEDYEADEEIWMESNITIFDGNGHTITLTYDEEDYVMKFNPYQDLTISNLTLTSTADHLPETVLAISAGSYGILALEDSESEGEGIATEPERFNVTLDGVTLEGGLYSSLAIEGAYADLTLTDCEFTASDEHISYIVYNPSTTPAIDLDYLRPTSEVAVEDFCTFDLSGDISYSDSTVMKMFINAKKVLKGIGMTEGQYDEVVEAINETVKGVEIVYGMYSSPKFADERMIYGFCDKVVFDLVIHFNKFFEGLSGVSMYLNEFGYNWFMFELGGEMFASEGFEYYLPYYSKNPPELEEDDDFNPAEWDVQVELLKDVTLWSDEFIEYIYDDLDPEDEDYEEDLEDLDFYLNDVFAQPLSYSINGNGYVFTMNRNAYPGPLFVYGYGEVTYENVIFNMMNNEASDYGIIFMSYSGDYQTTVTLDAVSVMGGNRAAILVQGSNVNITSGQFSANEGAIGGIEFAPYYPTFTTENAPAVSVQEVEEEGDEEGTPIILSDEPFFGTLTVTDDVATGNDHRVFIHKDCLEYVAGESGDVEAALATMQEYIEGATLVIDEEDGNAYEIEPEEEYWAITFDANGGTGTMSGDQVVKGEKYKLPANKFTAPSKKKFSKWEVNGKQYAAGKQVEITADTTIKAIWASNSTGGGGGVTNSPTEYEIKITANGAKVTPENTTVKKGGSITLKFEAPEGVKITDIILDGKSIGVVDSYKLENVRTTHTVIVTTKDQPQSKASDWAKDLLVKAAENGLIPDSFKGLDFTGSIRREQYCAAQVALYEALTQEKAVPAKNCPFKDNQSDAVLKAYELGITNGISRDEFGNGDISREQASAMTERTLEKAGIKIDVDLAKVERFKDDNLLHDWSQKPVYGLVQNNIIEGVGDNTFNAKGKCTIEQAIAVSERCVERWTDK